MNIGFRRKICSQSLSWLDIDKYDKTKDWALTKWATSLQFRYILKGLLSRCAVKDDDPLLKMLACIMVDPTPDANPSARSFLLASGLPMVFDMEVFDIIDATRGWRTDIFRDVNEAADSWQNALDNEDAPQMPDILRRGFSDLLEERAPGALQFEAVNVDLRGTDDQLIEDFKGWLAEKRASRRSNVPRKAATPAEMSDWHRFRVLALIDIDLFCSAAGGATATNATLGHVLFPNEYDVDLAERVRKVVRPMADKIMAPGFVAAICEQAARAERKS